MIGLIRKVMQLCCYPVRDATAPLIVNEYRMYIRTRHVLTGLTYPSEEPLDEDEATQANRELYMDAPARDHLLKSC